MSKGGQGNSNTETSFHFQSPSYGDGVKEALNASFGVDHFDGLRVMIATISKSGIEDFEEKFESFCRAGKSLNFLIGTGMTPDPRAIRRLRDLRDSWPQLVSLQLVQTDDRQVLFHPKLYWFHGNNQHRLFVGSANWTGRGHVSNIESITRTEFEVSPSKPPKILQSLNDAWTDVHESCQSNDGWGELLEPSDEVLAQLEEYWNQNSGTPEPGPSIDTSDSVDREGVWPLKNEGREMVMDLTMEQGGNRVSQVQPPLTVWRQFFDIEPEGNQPEYEIEDVRTGDKYHYSVVVHDHNWTLEIPGARVSRPAVIVFRLESVRHLKYAVYTPRDEEYDEIDQLLEDRGNKPHPQQKRRQYISVE